MALSQKAYGSKEHWQMLYEKNQLVIKDPNNLSADVEIEIPLLSGMNPQFCTGTTVGIVGATTDRLHTVSGASDYVKVSETPEALREQVQAHVDALTREGVKLYSCSRTCKASKTTLNWSPKGFATWTSSWRAAAIIFWPT